MVLELINNDFIEIEPIEKVDSDNSTLWENSLINTINFNEISIKSK